LQFGPDGRLYGCQVGEYGRIVAFDREGKLQVIADNVQPNDLVVTRNGGIYFTETRKQQVTYIAPGEKPVAVDHGIGKPNGIALTPDQGTLAVSDYGGKHGWVFRIELGGSLSFKQPYMTLRTPSPTAASRGDGMTTDASGRYYITSAVGLQMFDPTGRLGGVIASPQKKPLVSVALAGPDLSYLYVACGDKIYRRKTKTRGVLYFQKKDT
jgi:enterochelin esterase family protein